jgi:hypothetical protein
MDMTWYIYSVIKKKFCAMPPDMAADAQVKNRENVKISPVQSMFCGEKVVLFEAI